VHLPKRYSILKIARTVLVVDDDPSLLRGVGRVLTQHGFQAVLFNSAKELRLHNDFEQTFCIVLDIDLGDESGIALGQELSAAGVTLPVIYMTGKDSTTIRAAALATGCVAYLTKPFSGKSLIEPIQKAWDCLA
jgi:FixJ family two-component response regulator